jgi:hypothetical protein
MPLHRVRRGAAEMMTVGRRSSATWTVGRHIPRRWVAIGAMVAVGMVWLAPSASARHNLSMLRLVPDLSVPGGDVAVTGFSYTKPVSIHFDSISGPVLGTFTPDANSDLRGSVTVPPDTKPGSYLVFATQDEAGKVTRLPARARLTVAGGGGPPVLGGSVAPEPRVASLARKDEETKTGSLVLAGLAGAGVAMFLIGTTLVVASRRRSSAASSGTAS